MFFMLFPLLSGISRSVSNSLSHFMSNSSVVPPSRAGSPTEYTQVGKFCSIFPLSGRKSHIKHTFLR